MRTRWMYLCVLVMLLVPLFTGCTIYRRATSPQTWGLSLTEEWEYGDLRNSGVSHWEARRRLREKRDAKFAATDVEAMPDS